MNKKTKGGKKYTIIFSECGDISQGSSYEGKFYDSIAAAKADIDRAKEDFEGNIGAPTIAWIVEVVATGRQPSGFTWD